MSLGKLLALICIVIGFLSAAWDHRLLFDALTWFVAAVAIDLTLGEVSLGRFTVKKAE